jgi:MFS family permease
LIFDKTIIIGALSLAASQFLTLLVYPELWQRVYASKSLKDLRNGFIFAWLLLLIIIIPEIVIGLSARAAGGVGNPNDLFYDVLKLASPHWYLPVLSVALLAAFMSTLDSALFAIGAQFGKYGLWFRSTETSKETDKIIVKRIRYTIVVVTLIALALSLFFSNFLSAVFALISLLTVISVAILCSLLAKMSNVETTIVIIVGIACFLGMVFGGAVTSEPLSTLYPSFALVGYSILQTLAFKMRHRYGQRV